MSFSQIPHANALCFFSGSVSVLAVFITAKKSKLLTHEWLSKGSSCFSCRFSLIYPKILHGFSLPSHVSSTYYKSLQPYSTLCISEITRRAVHDLPCLKKYQPGHAYFVSCSVQKLRISLFIYFSPDQVRTNSSIIAHLTALYLLHPARPPHSIYVKMSKDKMDVCSSLSQRVSLRPCMFCLLLCSNVLTFPPCLSRFLFERSRSRVYALSAPLSKSVLSNLLCSKHSSVLLMILLGLSKSARVLAPALSEPLNRTMFYLLLCSNNPTSSLCLSRFLSTTSSSANMARLRH